MSVNLKRLPFTGLFWHIEIFLIGSWFGIIYEKLKLRKLSISSEWGKFAVESICWIVFCLMLSIQESPDVLKVYYIPLSLHLSYTAKGWANYVLYFAPLVLKELLFPGGITGFFEWELFQSAGKLSYSIYLLHPLILAHCLKSLSQDDSFYPIWLGMGVLALLSFNLIEKPGMQIGIWLEKFIRDKLVFYIDGVNHYESLKVADWKDTKDIVHETNLP